MEELRQGVSIRGYHVVELKKVLSSRGKHEEETEKGSVKQMEAWRN
jgi:hypothetical protein